MSKKRFEIDSVKMMRDIRNGLRKKYSKHPELREKDLAKVRRKYGIQLVRRKSA